MEERADPGGWERREHSCIREMAEEGKLATVSRSSPNPQNSLAVGTFCYIYGPKNETYFVLSNQMIAGGRSRERGERVKLVKSEACLDTPVPPRLPQEMLLPGGKRSERRPETSHASLSSFPEGLLHQLALGSGVHAPKTPFAGLILGAGHFEEVAVQRQVVSD